MDKAEKLDVEASRAKRLERVKAKQRDRGGIFKPSESNPLIDILLSRNFPAKSPAKPRLSKAGKLLSSRKSIGVPKTPRKSLSRTSSSRNSLKSQDIVATKNNVSKEKASKAKKPRNIPAQSSTVRTKLSNPDTLATAVEDVGMSEAGPSAPRKVSATTTSGPVDNASQKHPRTSEIDEEEFTYQKTDVKQQSRSKKSLEESKTGTKTRAKTKTKTKATPQSNTSTSKGKGKQVVTDSDDYDEKIALTDSATSSLSRKGKKIREDSDSSKNGSLSTTSRKKSRKASESSGPSLHEKTMETIPEADESEPISQKKDPKRRLEEDELSPRSSKKARVKDIPEKKKVTFAKSPKRGNRSKGKTKRNQILEEEAKETTHRKTNAETSSSHLNASSSAKMGKPKDVESTLPKAGYTNPDSLGETFSVAKSNKPRSSSKAKDVGTEFTGLPKNNISDSRSAQRKPPSSLSARPMSKKPDMSFRMRSVSYPSTMLGSPLKEFDSEQDPIDLLQ